MGPVLGIHYGIGVSLGLAFGVVGRWLGGPASSPWTAFVFGVGTTALPYCFMFPGMGFGVCGLKGPKEWKLASTALINHVFFGIGLAIAAYAVVPHLR